LPLSAIVTTYLCIKISLLMYGIEIYLNVFRNHQYSRCHSCSLAFAVRQVFMLIFRDGKFLCDIHQTMFQTQVRGELIVYLIPVCPSKAHTSGKVQVVLDQSFVGDIYLLLVNWQVELG
jgi:hypothetical protein